MKAKKRGPKPRHGKGRPCTRRSLSIPKDLYEWCVWNAMLEGMSVSRFIVRLIEKDLQK